MSTFGAWLQAWREAHPLGDKPMSSAELARRVGVKTPRVRAWEEGARPSYEMCQRIADGTGEPVELIRSLNGYVGEAEEDYIREATLEQDEKILVRHYRGASDAGKRALLQVAEELSESVSHPNNTEVGAS